MPLDFTDPKPLAEVAGSVSARTPVGSVLRSAEWEAVPEALRGAAFFSATVEEARWLAAAQEGIAKIAAAAREAAPSGDGTMLAETREKLMADLQELGRELGVRPRDPADAGTLRDPLSVRRLRLIIDTQLQMAHGYGDWLAGQDPDVLAEFPAQELVRVRNARVPRDWIARWQDPDRGNAPLIDGRMIALKTDPVWRRISRFGHPWPPFDFNSGMGVEDIDRGEAEDLGLIAPGDPDPEPAIEDYRAGIEANLKNLSPRFKGALQKVFGDQIRIEDGVARWAGGAA